MEEKRFSVKLTPQYPKEGKLNLEELYAEWYDTLEFSPDYFVE